MTKKQISVDRSYTVKQAAKQLNTTVHALRQAIHAGQIKAYKVSERNTRIDQTTLDDFRKKSNYGLPDKSRNLYKFAQKKIFLTINHFIDGDGFCSCDSKKKCKKPGAHPISHHGNSMDPVKNLYQIQLYDEHDEHDDYDIALYPSLSSICIIKTNRNADILCLANDNETPKFRDEDEDFFIFRTHDNANIQDVRIKIDGYDVEIIYKGTAIFTPFCKWEYPIENKIQELPEEIYDKLMDVRQIKAI